MRRIIKYLTIVPMLFTSTLLANNLSISNILFTTQDETNNTLLIQFDVSWENSWRNNSSAPQNWDGVWIFIKYRLKNSNVWNHATLSASSTDHIIPSSADIETTSNGVGLFLFPEDPGGTNNWSGNISWTGVQLMWNYGSDIGDNDNAEVQVKVFGIEMVYVPEAQFACGDNSLTNAFTETLISSNTIYPGSIVTSMPNGYDAFWLMKYEVTQEQYKEFLNTLTYDQQRDRTSNVPSDDPFSNAMVTNLYRTGLQIKTSGTNNTVPAVYGNNGNFNSAFDELGDCQDLPMAYIAWSDAMAYSDWAGLRPMTELEYEKACRGPDPGDLTSITAGEYAWGTNTRTALLNNQLSNAGAPNEIITQNANCNLNGGEDSPVRVGIFAAYNSASPNRLGAGAGYYGAMELSGSLWEQAIFYRTEDEDFLGTHGDGDLSGQPSDWPTTGTVRGGNYSDSQIYGRAADRSIAANSYNARYRTFGYRASRSSTYGQ